MKHECSGSCIPWTGTNKCHCTTCGQTFSTVANFDRHRDRGVCKNPKRLGMVQNQYGTWLMEGETDVSERFQKG